MNLLKRKDVMNRLNISKDTIKELEDSGALPVIRLKKKVLRYRFEDVERLIEKSTVGLN